MPINNGADMTAQPEKRRHMMQVDIKIRRQKNADSAPFYQTFIYEGDAQASIAYVLNMLNARKKLEDKDAKPNG